MNTTYYPQPQPTMGFWINSGATILRELAHIVSSPFRLTFQDDNGDSSSGSTEPPEPVTPPDDPDT